MLNFPYTEMAYAGVYIVVFGGTYIIFHILCWIQETLGREIVKPLFSRNKDTGMVTYSSMTPTKYCNGTSAVYTTSSSRRTFETHHKLSK